MDDVRPDPPSRSRFAPTSITVWGIRRPLVTRVALAFAHAVGSETFWFEIAARDAPVDPDEVAELRTLDSRHAFWVEPADIAPDARRGRPEHWTILSGLEDDPETPALVNLMKMPPRLRSLLLEHDPTRPAASVVLSNTDRAAQYYAAEAGTLSEAISVMNRLGFTFIATTGRVPRPNVRDFELVFEVVPEGDGRTGTVVCHSGDPALDPAFREGARSPLPAFLEGLRPAFPRSTQGAP